MSQVRVLFSPRRVPGENGRPHPQFPCRTWPHDFWSGARPETGYGGATCRPVVLSSEFPQSVKREVLDRPMPPLCSKLGRSGGKTKFAQTAAYNRAETPHTRERSGDGEACSDAGWGFRRVAPATRLRLHADAWGAAQDSGVGLLEQRASSKIRATVLAHDVHQSPGLCSLQSRAHRKCNGVRGALQILQQRCS